MHTLLIVKTGRTFEDLASRRGDFEHWFQTHVATAAEGAARFIVIDAQTAPELPPAGEYDGVLVTGSPSAVHDREPWSVRTGEWLRCTAEAGTPVLGVCYGHQLLADSWGGRSGRNPSGREIGVTEVTLHDPDPLFTELPPSFPVLTTHCDAVLTAPPHSRVLASNSHTAIQALAYGRRARTVQWHPEFDADVIAHYVRTRAPLIDAESGEGTAARLLREVREVPSGPVIFRNFIRYCIRGV